MLELLNQLDGFDSRGDVKVGPGMALHSVCVVECYEVRKPMLLVGSDT